MASIINASTSAGLVQTADTSGDLALQNNGTTAVTVTGGNVGIGRTNPGRPLDVNGSIRFSSGGVIEAGGSGGLNTYVAAVEGSSGYWSFAVNGAEQTRITVGGNLQFNSGYGSVATAYGCRAWVNFNGTGTVAIRASANVSSITDNGTGDYTVNFTNAMPDANYSASYQNSNGARLTWFDTFTTSSLRCYCYTVGGPYADTSINCIAVFR